MLCAYKTLLSSKSIVLASASERRKDILNILGFAYEVVPSPFNEDQNRPDTNDPQEFTKWTASQKALAIVEQLKHTSQSPDIIIGADTVVVHNSHILGKPTSAKNAVDMLKTLSGNTHSVVTGLSIFYKNKLDYKEIQTYEMTQVKMTTLSDTVINSYVESGEPLDKAGAYGIQGLGGTLIESISGDYYNVVGFPLHRFTVEIVKILQEFEETGVSTS